MELTYKLNKATSETYIYCKTQHFKNHNDPTPQSLLKRQETFQETAPSKRTHLHRKLHVWLFESLHSEFGKSNPVPRGQA